MSDAVREQLLGYLFGALDDDEQEELDRRFQTEPQLRAEFESLRARLPLPDRSLFEWEPPPGLAARTCRMVAAQRDAVPSEVASRPPIPMTSEVSPPAGRRGIRWIDAAMATAVAVAAFLVVAPAVQESREHARRQQCMENLHQVGLAMDGYSERSGGFFPDVLADGNASMAGMYLPILVRDGYLADASRAVCPGSPEAGRADLRGADWGDLRTLTSEAIDRLRSAVGGIYGYHPGHLENGAYRRTRNQRRPHMVILADSPGFGSPDFQSVNHGGRGQHALLEDGHVRFLPSPGPPTWREAIFLNHEGRVALPSDPDDAVVFPPTHPVGGPFGEIH